MQDDIWSHTTMHRETERGTYYPSLSLSIQSAETITTLTLTQRQRHTLHLSSHKCQSDSDQHQEERYEIVLVTGYCINIRDNNQPKHMWMCADISAKWRIGLSPRQNYKYVRATIPGTSWCQLWIICPRGKSLEDQASCGHIFPSALQDPGSHR